MENKRVKAIAAVAATGFVVAVFWRIDAVVLMAMAGLIVGLAIGIPLGAAGMYFVQRTRQQERERRQRRGVRGDAQVVIIPPGSAPQLPQGIGWPPWMDDVAHAPRSRQFTVIGDEES